MKGIIGIYMKKIFYVCITIILSCLIVTGLGNLVKPVESYATISAVETFHELPENTLEVIAFGSSHTWHELDPMLMYEKYGIGAYNYGCSWQRFNTSLLFLKDALRTQKPKIVLMETYLVNLLREDTTMDGELFYTTKIPYFEGKRQYLKQCFGNDLEKYLSYYMPLCTFHDNWININSESFELKNHDFGLRETCGYFPEGGVEPIDIPDYHDFAQESLSESALQNIDEIVDVCKANGVEIIFYTVPYEGEYAYSNFLKNYASEKGCAYINMFELIDEIGIDEETDFFDFEHLNENGAKKVSDYMGKYIIENYEVSDMRQIPNNLWEEGLEKTSEE